MPPANFGVVGAEPRPTQELGRDARCHGTRVAADYKALRKAEIPPFQVLLLTVSGWVNRHQADAIAYLLGENRALREQLEGRRLRLTDDQRRRLASKAKILGRRAPDHVATIVTPDTLMRWYRRLIACKWNHQAKRVGPPA